jgi:hypothetical protein
VAVRRPARSTERQPAVTGVALASCALVAALAMPSVMKNGTRSSMPMLPVPMCRPFRVCAISR